MLLLDVSVENNEDLLLDRTRQWCIVLCNKTLLLVVVLRYNLNLYKVYIFRYAFIIHFELTLHKPEIKRCLNNKLKNIF